MPDELSTPNDLVPLRQAIFRQSSVRTLLGDPPHQPGRGIGLYRIEVTEVPGCGVRILNRPAPRAFSESVKYAEANLYTGAAQLVGDRNPREHEFSV